MKPIEKLHSWDMETREDYRGDIFFLLSEGNLNKVVVQLNEVIERLNKISERMVMKVNE